ncbi:MAG: penicillin-insensitive murein endopeptidase [Deltaproteobacteria bacterium]|nr:penicillin-insensitive murein endopeptidase [Deltaproteobacteria bacterium]
MIRRALLGVALGAWALGCSTPSALAPGLRGSVGVPHSGFLTGGKELPAEGKGYKWKSAADHHWGLPRLVELIEESAAKVSDERPGSKPLHVGELSARGGGALMPKHRSHRTGRDVDLLFYLTTLEGVPAANDGFVKIGPDGLGVSGAGRFVRFDVDRNWILVRSMVASKKAHVQWIFISRVLEALLVERAIALGESPELVQRAQTVMQQPGDSLPHDDHIHLRVACEADEFVHGCEGGGPAWAWLPRPARKVEASPRELLFALLGPSVAGEVAEPIATLEAPE